MTMKELTDWDTDRIELIKKTYCKGGTDLDLQLFIATCERLKLSPEARQIYAVIRLVKNPNDPNGPKVPQMTIQVSIDGFRLVADRTGQYEGQTPVQWCDLDGIWREIWVKSTPPIAARVGVLKRGFRAPLYAVAHWSEYCQQSFGKLTQFWERMPRLMLGKVAEALALRKAFPNELSGVYAPEEIVETEAAPVKHRPFELAPTQEQIIPLVETSGLATAKPSAKERIPKMLDAFKEHFALEASELEALIHKPMGDLGDEDIKTLEKIFKDLKNKKLDKQDLESIKDVLGEADK